MELFQAGSQAFTFYVYPLQISDFNPVDLQETTRNNCVGVAVPADLTEQKQIADECRCFEHTSFILPQ